MAAPKADLERIAAAKPALRIIEDVALNAEAWPRNLDAPITPIEQFFVRNNGTTPDISAADAANWVLTVDGEVEEPRRWTVPELKQRFEAVTETAVIECAGNGRADFVPPTDGLQWGNGAVACGRWQGVRLADVLAVSRPKSTAVYVGHLSPDVMVDGSGKPALSRGLPLDKAMAPETLIAFALNGEPLAALHGAPLRIVAPGYPGSAWQKWLARLWVREREHDGEKMTGTNYRLPRTPLAPGDKVDPKDFDVITDMPVKSLITTPSDGFSAKAGVPLLLRGFAWSGHTPLASVAVSADGGKTWEPAQLDAPGDRFAWRRFSASLTPPAGPVTLCARATDAAGVSQPLDVPWNPRGYCNNAVQRVTGTVGAA